MFSTPLDYQAKQITYNFYRFLKSRKLNENSEEYINNIDLIDEVAKATGMSKTDVTNIVAEGNDMENRDGNADFKVVAKGKRKEITIDEYTGAVIRRKANQLQNLKRMQFILKQENVIECSKDDLINILTNLGFTNYVTGILKERNDIVSERNSYLQALKSFRNQHRPLFYLNETKFWINYENQKPIEMPSFLIVHMSGKKGFLDNTKLMLKLKPKSEEDECFEHFENYDWIKDNVLQNMPPNSVVIVNIPKNETTESMHCEEIPNKDCSRNAIENWLARHNIPYEESASESDLRELINKQEKTEFSITKIIKQNGHEVLYLPQSHYDLNPATVLWHDLNKSRKLRKKSVYEFLLKYTESNWEKIFDHIRVNEGVYNGSVPEIKLDDNILKKKP